MLRLEARTGAANDSRVMIHDLAEKGMLLECDEALAVGEKLDLIIPEAGSARASIVWNSGRYYGCRFATPLSSAAVSAALLRSPPPATQEERRRAVYNAMAELRSLAKSVEQITEQVERTIDAIRNSRP